MMVHQNSYKESVRDCESSWMRMIEGSIHESAGMRIMGNIVTESAAVIVRSRDDQHRKDFDLETQLSYEIRVVTRTVDRKTVFNVETTENLGSKDIVVSLGKEIMSPEKEVHKPNFTVALPCSTKSCPLRSRRASLVDDRDFVAILIIGKMIIYRPQSMKNLAPSAARGRALIMKVSRCDLDLLVNKLMTSKHGHQLFGILSTPVVVEKKLNTTSKEFQESLTLDVNMCTSGVKKMVERLNQRFNAILPSNAPVRIPLKHVNICTGRVKNMVERFRQSSMITSSIDAPLRTSPQDVNKCTGGVKNMVEKFSKSFKVTSPNEAPLHVPRKYVNVCTGGVKKMVQKFSRISLVRSPNNTPPKFRKFTTDPLELSTVNPSIKMVLPKVETPNMLPVASEPALPLEVSLEFLVQAAEMAEWSSAINECLGASLLWNIVP